ncbi:MAG: ATP-binding protein [Sedimentisphaerales bacterium]|nr:ATP-binding protein [Sedimentisphaerales bacterium]
MHECKISSCFCQAKQLEDDIVNAAQECGHDEESIFALRLSLEEAFANAIRHGNQQDKTKNISVRYSVTKECIEIFVADEGLGFDPSEVPDPTEEKNLQKPTGRGIMLMRSYMNLVEYNETGNMLHLVKLGKVG